MKICYVTTDSLSEGVGRSQIVPLVQGLAEAGHEVIVISMEKIENFVFQEKFRESGITWIPLKFGKRGLIAGISRLLKLLREIPDADVYHARSDIPAIALIIRRKSPILWDVRSLWMEQRTVISDNKLPLRLIKSAWVFAERFISRRSAAVNTLALELQPVLIDRLGKIPDVRTVIPTTVDLSTFKFIERLPTPNVVVLSGTFNGFYDKQLTSFVMQSLVDIGYLAIWCRPEESLDSFLSVSRLRTVEVRHEDMPSWIADSTLGVVICRSDVGVSLKGVMPTKVAEFLATGRPVIASKGMGDLDKLLTDYRAGILIDDKTKKEDLYCEVSELLSDPNTPMRCRRLAEEKFSMSLGVRTYLNTYSAIAVKVS